MYFLAPCNPARSTRAGEPTQHAICEDEYVGWTISPRWLQSRWAITAGVETNEVATAMHWSYPCIRIEAAAAACRVVVEAL